MLRFSSRRFEHTGLKQLLVNYAIDYIRNEQNYYNHACPFVPCILIVISFGKRKVDMAQTIKRLRLENNNYSLTIDTMKRIIFRDSNVREKLESAVKPQVKLLQIQEVHPGPHSSVRMHFFPTVLSRPSFTSRVPIKDQDKEALLLSIRSNAIIWRYP